MAKIIIQKVTDIVSILFPAVLAVLGVLHLSGAVAIANTVEQIVMICCGAAASIASVVYNQVTKNDKS